MKFETAKTVVKGTLLAGVLLCVIALFVQKSMPGLGMMLTFAGMGCVIVCLFFVITAMKCPYCGKRIFRNCLVVKVCPHCRRDLASGLKVKSKKKK